MVRRRWVGTVWHELLELRNYTHAPSARIVVDLEVAADFADVFEIKEGHDNGRASVSTSVDGRASTASMFGWRHGTINRRAELTVDADGVQTSRQRVPVDRSSSRPAVDVAHPRRPRRSRSGIAVDRAPPPPSRTRSAPASTTTTGSTAAPAPAHRLTHASPRRTHTSVEDLASLRLHDPTGKPPSRRGSRALPWYMTLFGRDALITCVHDPARSTARWHLACSRCSPSCRAPGSTPATEEEPGRIVHETRQLGLDGISLTRHGLYYGSADATPLFVDACSAS